MAKWDLGVVNETQKQKGKGTKKATAVGGKNKLIWAGHGVKEPPKILNRVSKKALKAKLEFFKPVRSLLKGF